MFNFLTFKIKRLKFFTLIKKNYFKTAQADTYYFLFKILSILVKLILTINYNI